MQSVAPPALCMLSGDQLVCASSERSACAGSMWSRTRQDNVIPAMLALSKEGRVMESGGISYMLCTALSTLVYSQCHAPPGWTW